MERCDIFLVFPEINAKALDRALTGPSSATISYAMSLKYCKTLSSTVLSEITISLALDLIMSTG